MARVTEAEVREGMQIMKDIGAIEYNKKAAEDKKELDAIKGKSGDGKAGNGEDAQQPKKNGDPDILNNMKKPKSTVTKDADEFL